MLEKTEWQYSTTYQESDCDADNRSRLVEIGKISIIWMVSWIAGESHDCGFLYSSVEAEV
jgi:hypothetical protein